MSLLNGSNFTTAIAEEDSSQYMLDGRFIYINFYVYSFKYAKHEQYFENVVWSESRPKK